MRPPPLRILRWPTGPRGQMEPMGPMQQTGQMEPMGQLEPTAELGANGAHGANTANGANGADRQKQKPTETKIGRGGRSPLLRNWGPHPKGASGADGANGASGKGCQRSPDGAWRAGRTDRNVSQKQKSGLPAAIGLFMHLFGAPQEAPKQVWATFGASRSGDRPFSHTPYHFPGTMGTGAPPAP